MMKPSEIFIKDFDYDLPEENIAAHPLKERDASKLLIYQDGNISIASFNQLANHLPLNAALILNNTRVIEARILFQKQTGAVIEIFCLEPDNLPHHLALSSQEKIKWNCLIGGASKWNLGKR